MSVKMIALRERRAPCQLMSLSHDWTSKARAKTTRILRNKRSLPLVSKAVKIVLTPGSVLV